MQQDEELLVDPEEQKESRLVYYMAVAVVAVTAGGILFLALRPWIQRFRETQQEAGGVDTAPTNGEVTAA